MALLQPTPVSTKQFTYTPADGMLVAEASSLPQPGRVYDDACDVGYTVVSARTGRQVVVALEHVQRDSEGEVQWWDYMPAQYQPLRPRLVVRVYND